MKITYLPDISKQEASNLISDRFEKVRRSHEDYASDLFYSSEDNMP